MAEYRRGGITLIWRSDTLTLLASVIARGSISRRWGDSLSMLWAKEGPPIFGFRIALRSKPGGLIFSDAELCKPELGIQLLFPVSQHRLLAHTKCSLAPHASHFL